jgi:hypothetical protein
MNKATEFVNNLRAAADWIEAHPDIAAPDYCDMTCYSLDEREDAARVLAALKPCEKRYGEEMFFIERKFGPVKLRYAFYRDKVCTRRVVGTRVIPAQEIPERIEEIVEWDCGEPLLPQAQAA